MIELLGLGLVLIVALSIITQSIAGLILGMLITAIIAMAKVLL